MLENVEAQMPPIASVPHDELVLRALQRRKPFAASGAGYRDALIWHTIIDLLADQRDCVVFVTNNASDFAEPKAPTVLAKDLKHDLREREIDLDRISLVPTLEAFAREYLAPETLAEGELDQTLNRETPLRERFAETLRTALSGHVFDRDDIRRLDADRFDLGIEIDELEIDSAEIREAHKLYGVWVISANLLDERHALVELEAEMDVELDATLDIQRHRSLFDEDWPRRERHTRTLETTVLIGAEATYRRDTQTLEELNVYHVGV